MEFGGEILYIRFFYVKISSNDNFVRKIFQMGQLVFLKLLTP